MNRIKVTRRLKVQIPKASSAGQFADMFRVQFGMTIAGLLTAGVTVKEIDAMWARIKKAVRK